MFPLLASALGNWRTILMGVAAAAALAFAVSWYWRGETITNLRQENTILTQKLEVAEAQLEIARNTARITTDRVRERDNVRDRAFIVRDRINAASPSDDAPVAPVLRDALTGIRSLREQPRPADRRP